MRKHVETAWRASKRKESLHSRFHRCVRHKCGNVKGLGFPFSMDVPGRSVEELLATLHFTL